MPKKLNTIIYERFLKVEKEYNSLCEPKYFDSPKLNELEELYFEYMEEYDFDPYIFTENGLKGMKDALDRELIPPLFEDIKYKHTTIMSETLELGLNHALLAVKSKNKWGLLSTKGNLQVKATFCYDDITPVDFNMVGVCINSKWGYLNLESKQVTKIRYDEILPLGNNIESCGFSVFRLEEKYGVTDGQRTTDTIFNKVDKIVFDSYIVTSKENMRGYIDINGNFTSDKEKAEWGRFSRLDLLNL